MRSLTSYDCRARGTSRGFSLAPLWLEAKPTEGPAYEGRDHGAVVSGLPTRASTQRVRVVADDSGLLDDLADYLGRLGCEVEKAVDSLEVSIPFVPEVLGERVLSLFLSNWRSGKASIQ
jgi:hypothetical protein